jgi:HEPN domain-containing protein
MRCCENSADPVPFPAVVVAAANRQDLFCASPRYPDALGGAGPRKVLQDADAAVAIEQARQVVGLSETVIDGALRDGK